MNNIVIKAQAVINCLDEVKYPKEINLLKEVRDLARSQENITTKQSDLIERMTNELSRTQDALETERQLRQSQNGVEMTVFIIAVAAAAMAGVLIGKAL